MRKMLLLLLPILLMAVDGSAHVIKYELEEVDQASVFADYLRIGFEHIIPMGLDHILFIICVFFLNSGLKQVIWQASMFTVAHSITLALAIYGVISPPAELVEPLIAFSIVLLALENIFQKKVKPWRLLMIFLFGLVHGMGFAGALSELGLPRNAFATALVSFNVGVEMGQLAIILLMYLFVNRLFSQKSWYRTRIVMPASLLIALVAGYWTIERIFFAT